MLKEQLAVSCTLMRGGTSKAVFLKESDVPNDPEERRRFLLALFGSPDPRQIDGLGGADILTSKCALIGPSSRSDADVNYTFAQIGVAESFVSYEIVCGNISSAAGVYAVQEGYVTPSSPHTLVRVHNTNTGKVLRMQVPVLDGEVQVEGGLAIDGVPGTGAEVALDYSDTAGGATGSLLPTGRVRDEVFVPALGRHVPISIVDVGTVCVFYRASDLGLQGTEMPGGLEPEIFVASEQIRKAAAALAGLPEATQITPFQIMLSPATSYDALGGLGRVNASDIDLVARMLGSNGMMHKAFPGGGTVCLSVAAQIEGSVAAEMRGTSTGPARIRIGHPSGQIGVWGHVELDSRAEWKVREVHFSRTARRLFDGTAYVRRSRL
jgi:2-methylaconitate cis-trans-isomerase PrpF